MLNIFQKYLLSQVRIQIFISKCIDDFIILGSHTFKHFMSHALQSILFRVVYPTAESRYPFLIETLPLPLTTINLQNDIPNVVLESSPNVLEPQRGPILNPLPSPSCIPSSLAAPSHDSFYFLNYSLSRFSKYRHIHIFSKVSYFPLFSG